MENKLIPEENIASKIFLIRGERVMLDSDLAQIYGVSTTRLNEQTKRNIDRFPPDFMFELTKEEFENLISQNAISRWGGRRKLPKVFTEHGAIMLASVLNSDIAVKASIQVVRVFIKLREFVLMSKEITKKLEEFEAKTDKHLLEHDKLFQVVFDTLKKVLTQDEKPKKPIGFIMD
ncbi:MAG: hypothetical protein HW421_2126 [Ignavibacteria bacterium]|nr:hypothetical protein [Ignavibacteria bacterium]